MKRLEKALYLFAACELDEVFNGNPQGCILTDHDGDGVPVVRRGDAPCWHNGSAAILVDSGTFCCALAMDWVEGPTLTI